MNNFNWEEFKNGRVAVWCKTKESANDFMEKCYERNITWFGGNIEKNYHDFFNDKTCYEYSYKDKRLIYSDFKYFKNLNYKIIEWAKEEYTIQEVISNIKEGQHWESGLFTIKLKSENKIELHHKDSNEIFVININEDLFKLKEQEVPVLEAMKSFNEGKTIKCKFKGCEKSKKAGKDFEEIFIPIDYNCLCEDDVITPYMIVNGKWYVREE